MKKDEGYWVDLSHTMDYYQTDSKGERIKVRGGAKQWVDIRASRS